MYVTWGSYTHGVGECDVAIARTSEYNESGQRWAIRERWDIKGLLTNTSGDLTTMNSLSAALIAAYGNESRDLKLHMPDTTATTHQLLTANCLGGTKVVQPVSFPTGQGAEAITYRTYTVSVEGLVPVGSQTWYSFNENLTFSGGGRAYGLIETLTGYPVKQKLREHTIFQLTQEGECVGLTTYPSVPAPLFPNDLVRAPRITQRSPRRYGSGSHRMYPITWQYLFESAAPMYANPNKWT